MIASSARRGAGLAAVLALGGCSWLNQTYSQTVATDTNAHIHASVPVGTTMDTAEARLESQGFDCEIRTGDFTDEFGHRRNAERFLSCVHRASTIGFACENRDQVVVLPAGGVVDEVDVTRGPDCSPREAPPLMAPNSAK